MGFPSPLSFWEHLLTLHSIFYPLSFHFYLFRSLFSPAGGQGAVFSQKGAASVGENQESIRLLHTIRNMLIGIGLMVSALGLLAFGYLFAEGTNLFTALFLVSALLFLTGTIWW